MKIRKAIWRVSVWLFWLFWLLLCESKKTLTPYQERHLLSDPTWAGIGRGKAESRGGGWRALEGLFQPVLCSVSHTQATWSSPHSVCSLGPPCPPGPSLPLHTDRLFLPHPPGFGKWWPRKMCFIWPAQFLEQILNLIVFGKACIIVIYLPIYTFTLFRWRHCTIKIYVHYIFSVLPSVYSFFFFFFTICNFQFGLLWLFMPSTPNQIICSAPFPPKLLLLTLFWSVYFLLHSWERTFIYHTTLIGLGLGSAQVTSTGMFIVSGKVFWNLHNGTQMSSVH